MRKVILYIAMSLDGFIADTDGGVSWLGGDGSDVDAPGSYSRFLRSVDTIIMGHKTYQQIVSELSPDAWVYVGKKSYVITHRHLESSDEITFTDKDPSKLLAELKRKNGKNIWICGGASIVNQLLDADLIDRFYVTIIPTIMGNGIRLFSTHEKEARLKFISTQNYNGMVDLVYERRRWSIGMQNRHA